MEGRKKRSRQRLWFGGKRARWIGTEPWRWPIGGGTVEIGRDEESDGGEWGSFVDWIGGRKYMRTQK